MILRYNTRGSSGRKWKHSIALPSSPCASTNLDHRKTYTYRGCWRGGSHRSGPGPSWSIVPTWAPKHSAWSLACVGIHENCFHNQLITGDLTGLGGGSSMLCPLSAFLSATTFLSLDGHQERNNLFKSRSRGDQIERDLRASTSYIQQINWFNKASGHMNDHTSNFPWSPYLMLSPVCILYLKCEKSFILGIREPQSSKAPNEPCHVGSGSKQVLRVELVQHSYLVTIWIMRQSGAQVVPHHQPQQSTSLNCRASHRPCSFWSTLPYRSWEDNSLPSNLKRSVHWIVPSCPAFVIGFKRLLEKLNSTLPSRQAVIFAAQSICGFFLQHSRLKRVKNLFGHGPLLTDWRSSSNILGIPHTWWVLKALHIFQQI